MHQQLMIAQRIAAGGGGGLPPNTYAGLTMAYDADASAIYKGGSTSSGLAVNDGDAADRVDSNYALTKTMFDNTGSAAILETGFFGSNRAVHLSNATHQGYTKPSGTNVPSSQYAISTLVAAGNKVIIWAGQVNSAGVNSGSAYTNQSILADLNGWQGLHCYGSGGNIVFQAYNSGTGGDTIITATEVASTPVVIMMMQTGNVLRIWKNGVEIATTAATNTAGTPGFAYTGSGNIQLYTNKLYTYNQARTQAEMLEVQRYAGAAIGVSF